MIQTPEMEVATKYGSHMPSLLACIAVTEGPVLELGVGHFSTPHLHAICGAMNRAILSSEENVEWREEFAIKYASSGHVFVSKWVANQNDHWAVALIDHSPGGANRAAAFKALIETCDYIVMHDSQKDAENFQAVEPMLAGLNWHLCTGYFPHTLCASKTKTIPQILLGI